MLPTVQLETTPSHSVIARLGSPFELSAEAGTIGEALEKLGQETQRQETQKKVPFIEVPEGDHPWLKWAGTLPDDELTRAWQQDIREARERERMQEKTFEEM